MAANRITKPWEMYPINISYKVLTGSVDTGKELWIVWLETKISSNLLKESKKTLCLFSLPEADSTGSGCAPIVAEMLLEEKDEEGNPVKTRVSGDCVTCIW